MIAEQPIFQILEKALRYPRVPATRWFNYSFALALSKYNERFARHYRRGPHRSFLWLWRSHAYLALFRIISRWPHIETSLNRSVRFWCMDLNYHFHCDHRFTHLGVCAYVRLLGPCFKTGCVKSIVAIFMSRLATPKNQPNAQNVYKLQTANWHARQETSRTHSRSLSTQLFFIPSSPPLLTIKPT